MRRWRGGGGAGAAAQNTHLQKVVVVLQHAVSLARVCEDPSGVLIVVEWGPWGSGGELLKERRARHRLGGCLPGGCLPARSTDRPFGGGSPSCSRERAPLCSTMFCSVTRLPLQTVWLADPTIFFWDFR